MNILLDDLPETVTVDGEEYFADADFRTMIILEKIITDDTLDARSRVGMMVDLVLTDTQPAEKALAVDGIIYLYSCGKPSDRNSGPAQNGNMVLRPKMIYDYEHDAPYIYGAFMSQYGIDLNSIDFLHWWKFQALFRSLNSNNKIVEIMGYRATDLSKIKSDEERQRIRELQNVYALPQNYTYEEKVAMAGAAFAGGFR